MNILGAICFCSVYVIAAFAAPSSHFDFDVLEKNATSAKVRFRTTLAARKYYVNVVEKYMADVPADYFTTLNGSDKQEDGYFYIDTGNTLTPGTLYEALVMPHIGMSGSIDFFTDCDEYSFPCTTFGQRQACFGSSKLCNGVNDCSDGSDELKSANGTCLAQVLERPTPPPPPSDTPCMQERSAGLQAGRPLWRVTVCEPDGSYSPMRCDYLPGDMTCHCVHPVTNGILYSQINYSPFVHHNFYDKCVDFRTKLKRRS